MKSTTVRSASLVVLAVFLLLAAAGCGTLNARQTGPTETIPLSADYPAGGSPRLVVSFGAARMQADANGARLVEGSVTENFNGLRPEVTTRGSQVDVRQTVRNIPSGTVNDWELHFGKAQPYALELNAGAYDGDWELGGLPLTELLVQQGASRSRFSFSAPNPQSMSRLEFRTGAAELTLTNLCNAGFQSMVFDGGAASYTLDFGGQLMRDAHVDIHTGVSSLTIVVPPQTPAEVVIQKGLSGSQVDPVFVQQGDRYQTPAWSSAGGPRLTIQVQVGLGNVILRAGSPSGSEL